MGGPWEKFQPQPSGPWTKFQQADITNDAVAQPERKAADYGEALLTNLPTKGFGQDIVRGLPATGGALAGAGAGMAAVAPFAPLAGPFAPAVLAAGGIGGAFLGGAAGESVRQATTQGAAAAFPEQNYPMASPGEVLRNVGIQGATQAAGEGIGIVAAPVVRAGGRALVNNPIARAVGGYTKEAAERLLARPKEVIAQMGEGAIGQAAQSFKEAVGGYMDEAGKAYRGLIDNVIGQNPKYGPGFKLNLQDGIGDDLARIAKDYGYGQPGRLAEGASQERFLQFLRKANELSDASPESVYYFQRDLNNAIRSTGDDTLKSALRQVKSSTSKFLEGRIPEIGAANRGYAQAAELVDDLAGVTNSDDAARIIAAKLRGSGETKQAILDAAERVPAIREALESVLDSQAAGQFNKGVPDIPRTGFGASLTLGLNQVFNPGAVAVGTMGAAGVSPLATAYAVRGVQAAAPTIYRVGAGATAAASGATGSALQDAYLKRRIPQPDPAFSAIGGMRPAYP